MQTTIQASALSAEEKYSKGIRLYSEGRFREALAVLEDALRNAQDPRAEFWNDWGVAALACGEVEKAERGFRSALDLSPEDIQAAENLGVLLAGLGRPGEAIPFLARSVTSANGEQRAKLEQLLTGCRNRVAAETVSQSQTAFRNLVSRLESAAPAEAATHAKACTKISAVDLRSGFRNDGILKTYTIAFSPRCGSTLMSEILTAAGIGAPTEYFQNPYRTNKNFEAEKEEFMLRRLRSLVRERSANNIFGSKMSPAHRAQLDWLLEPQVANYEGIDSIFPDHRWIFVKRKDLTRQAISWFIAGETQVWHIKQNQTDSAEAKVEYNFFSILSTLKDVLADNLNWELYFQKNALFPLTLFYEDFVADKKSALRLIATHIGIGSEPLMNAALNMEGGLTKISDRYGDLYESMRERFTHDFLRIGHI
jgi:trehalose 2-sulfotransferase